MVRERIRNRTTNTARSGGGRAGAARGGLLAICSILAGLGSAPSWGAPASSDLAIHDTGASHGATGPTATPARSAATTLPFHTVRGFILVNGEVDGVAGVFILDTGTPFSFFLNRAFVPLTDGEQAAVGNAASGQPVEVQLHRQAHAIRLADGARFDLNEVRSGDFGFVANGLGIPLLGFIGVGLLRDYRFEIDYRRSVVVLRPPDVPERRRASPVATIRFRLNGHMPAFPIAIGGVTVPAMLDTGAPDSVSLTRATRDRLTAAGLLAVPSDGTRRISLSSLGIGSSRLPLADAADGGEKRDMILLGHGFLSRYRSVWDYRQMTVTLLPR